MNTKTVSEKLLNGIKNAISSIGKKPVESTIFQGNDITKNMDRKWFTDRDKFTLQYQQEAIAKIQDKMVTEDIVVLGSCPSSGKTLMATYIIEKYLKANPGSKVLVLSP